MDSICLIVCLSWLTGCLLRLYRGTAERNNNAVILWNNYDIVTTFGANTRTCLYFCHVDYYVLVWLFIVQLHNSFLPQLSLELSHLIDLLILAVLAGLLRHLRQLIYSRIYWCDMFKCGRDPLAIVGWIRRAELLVPDKRFEVAGGRGSKCQSARTSLSIKHHVFAS